MKIARGILLLVAAVYLACVATLKEQGGIRYASYGVAALAALFGVLRLARK